MASPGHDDKPKASTRTFGIVELAERIFLNLKFADLLKMQRVSKHANQVIADSTPLKQKLHLAPTTGDEPENLLPVLPKHMQMIPYCYDATTPELAFPNLVIRPHIKECILFDEAGKHLDSFTFSNPSTSDSSASWRKMLLTEPPLRHACYTRNCERDDRCDFQRKRYPFYGTMQNQDGITLGELEGMMLEMQEHLGYEGLMETSCACGERFVINEDREVSYLSENQDRGAWRVRNALSVNLRIKEEVYDRYCAGAAAMKHEETMEVGPTEGCVADETEMLQEEGVEQGVFG